MTNQGTQAENMLDKVSKGRQMRGEAHVGAKLTDWQISEVRDAAIGGESQRSIARRYGIAQSHVWRIVNRLSRVS